MKKTLALIMALLMLLSLGACSQESAEQPQSQQQGAAAPEKTGEDAAATSEEELYVEELEKDGIKVTNYRKGGKDGVIVKDIWDYPDGAHYESTYDEDGKPITVAGTEADGTRMEMSFYPSGNMEKDKITYPDGSWDETHYSDNGYVDEETGYLMSGTITYQAHGTADGQVEERISDVEVQEDGTWWETQELEGGATAKIHYAEGWRVIEEYFEDPVNGYTTETRFYESGKQKEVIWTFTNSTEYRYTEYYENGVTKISESIGADGREINYQCNEEGYYTYYYDHDQYGTREYFAGENNELVKYIENDKIYEGDAITENQRNVFKQMQDMAAEVAYNMINGI